MAARACRRCRWAGSWRRPFNTSILSVPTKKLVVYAHVFARDARKLQLALQTCFACSNANDFAAANRKSVPGGTDCVAPAHQLLKRLRTERIHFRSGRQGPGAWEGGNHHREVAAREIDL